MDNYEFTLANYRFHIKNKNKFIFTGFFRDDNPENRSIKVYFDKTPIDVTYEIKSGVETRQKYLMQKANISEEIIGEIDLKEGWQNHKCFRVESVLDNSVVEVCNIPVKRMVEMRNAIQYSVEKVAFSDNKVIVTGWAVDEEPIEITVCKGNEVVKSETSWTPRRDVTASFFEVDPAQQTGFKVVIEAKDNTNLRMIMKTSAKETVYRVQKNGMSAVATVKDKVVFYFKRYGLKQTMIKSAQVLAKNNPFRPKNKNEQYAVWRRKYEVTEEELLEQKKVTFSVNPKFSIVIPLYNTVPKYLKELIESVQNQTYENWELCLADGTGEHSPLKSIVDEYAKKDERIKYEVLSDNKGISENTNAAIRMATGEYIVLADHDDIVSPNALFECAKAINENANVDVIYSDEDKIDMDGKKYFEPHFKSDFNIDLLCSMNYICHLFVVKKEIIDNVGMLRSEFDGAQDHDFIFRCCEVAEHIVHIPKILYHWRCHINSTAENPESKLYAFEAGRKAVEEHYKRVGIPATVEHAEFYGMFRTKYHWEETPLISIVIPNKDHIEDLQKIINSIEDKSTYRNYEFIVVENNSTEPETFAFYKELEKKSNVRVLYYEGGFNYSKINNFGVTKSNGEYILLLNNDTELIAPDALEEMLHICMREEVGIVGAKLCYDDDTIQHAGVVLGYGGIAGHTFIGSSRYDTGYMNRIVCVQDYSAVTAACLMTKKTVFEAVCGLSEDFVVALNDIDYCMKVRSLGKLVVYTPYAELYHYESKSRGLEDTPEKIERFNTESKKFIDKWNKELLAGDPYYNVNLTLDKADFSIKE